LFKEKRDIEALAKSVIQNINNHPRAAAKIDEELLIFSNIHTNEHAIYL